jgi:hypothetical protein
MALPRSFTSYGALEPGDRDQIVVIQQCAADESASTSGYPVETWSTLVAAMPASKLDLGGRERFTGQQLAAAYDTRWQINYRLDMDPDLVDVPKRRRLVHRGRVHDIVAAAQIGRRDGIELLTLAATRAGS